MSDSGTDSESEKEQEHILDRMTKEELWYLLKSSGCSMLAGRNPRYMTKQMMIDYLMESSCPVLLRIINPIKKDASK